MERVAVFEQKNGVTRMPLQLKGTESVSVVFRHGQEIEDPFVSVTREGQPISNVREKIVVQKANYGVPGDPSRMRDVTAKVQALIDGGQLDFDVASLAAGDDPAYGSVKTLKVDYTIDGKPNTISGRDRETISLTVPEGGPMAQLRGTADGQWQVEAWRSGHYALTTAAGKVVNCEAREIPGSQDITGPWELTFPANSGAPEKITLDQLVSWSHNTIPGVEYFSGTATYRKTFRISSGVNLKRCESIWTSATCRSSLN